MNVSKLPENTDTNKCNASKKNLSISNINEEKTPQKRKRVMNKSVVNEFRGHRPFPKSKEEFLDISVNNLEQVSQTPKNLAFPHKFEHFEDENHALPCHQSSEK